MDDDLFKMPEFGAELPACAPSEEFLATLLNRRSTTAAMLGDPGPNEDELELILRAGARVPDHRRVAPFRFIVFSGDARARFGDVLKSSFRKSNPGADEDSLRLEAGRFLRAPVVIGVISSVDPNHKTPEWEQVLCCGAVCQNILLAASASGYAAQWLTEWYAYNGYDSDGDVGPALSLTDDERIAGFIYIGTAKESPRERARPDLASKITRY